MTIIKPGYHPNYPEYKWRCGMRCGDIWKCWGPKSFYSKLIRAWYQSKSAQPVLEKLNENPEWSVQKLAEEWHLICEFQEGGNTKLKSDTPEEGPTCLLARHLGEVGSTNTCYNFWDWKKAFIFGLTKTKSAVDKPEWSSVDCWPYATIEDLHVLCNRYWIDYVLYQLNNDEIEPQPDYVGDNWCIGINWEKECFCGYYLYTVCLRRGTKAKREPKGPCWRKRKCTSLLTYEELEKIWSATRVLEELNSHPVEYFQSLAPHLTQDSEYPSHRRLGDGCRSFSESIRFEADVNLRTSLSCYQ